MTKRERIMAAVRLEPVDRVPYSFWYHFPVEDKAGDEFVRSEIEFATFYDVDMLKVMMDIPYELPTGKEMLQTADDWASLEPLPPDAGSFKRHYDALVRIKDGLPDDRPIVNTIFSAFSTAQHITRSKTLEHLAQDREAVQAGLAVIAQSLGDFARYCNEKKVTDGFYLAVSAASPNVTPLGDYVEDFYTHDMTVAEAVVGTGTLNCLHIHDTAIYFEQAAKLPADVVGWSDRTTGFSLSEGRNALPDRCLMGGVNEVTAGTVSPDEIRSQVHEAIRELDGRGLILASGCAVPTDAPRENLLAIKEAVLSHRT